MTLTQELEALSQQAERVVAKCTQGLYTDLVKASPVDTGNFRSAWTLTPINKLTWEIRNPVDYASILWEGRRQVGDTYYGSAQWPGGGDPMLAQANRKLQADLDSIRV